VRRAEDEKSRRAEDEKMKGLKD